MVKGTTQSADPILIVHEPEVSSEAKFNTTDIVAVGVTAFERDVEEAAAQIRVKIDETNARISELNTARAKVLKESQDETVEAQKKVVLEAAKLLGLNGRVVASNVTIIQFGTVRYAPEEGEEPEDVSEDVKLLNYDLQANYALENCTKKMCNRRIRPFSLTISVPGQYPAEILQIRDELAELNKLLNDLNAAYVDCRSKLDPGSLNKLERNLKSALVEGELTQTTKGKQLLATLQGQHESRVKKITDKVSELTGRTTKLLGGPSKKK